MPSWRCGARMWYVNDEKYCRYSVLWMFTLVSSIIYENLKIKNRLYHDAELEFGAYTGSTCSTHEYFESWRDELLTPSQCWEWEFSFLNSPFWWKRYVNYLIDWSFSTMNFQSNSHHDIFKLRDPMVIPFYRGPTVVMNCIDLIFYRHRSTQKVGRCSRLRYQYTWKV